MILPQFVIAQQEGQEKAIITSKRKKWEGGGVGRVVDFLWI